MNTDQKYEGRGNNAPPTEPTAQTKRDKLKAFRRWQTEFLQQVATDEQQVEDLFEVLELARAFYEGTNPIPGLCTLLYDHLTDLRGNPNHSASDIAFVIALISRVDQLRTAFSCFNTSTDYLVIYEEAAEKGGVYDRL